MSTSMSNTAWLPVLVALSPQGRSDMGIAWTQGRDAGGGYISAGGLVFGDASRDQGQTPPASREHKKTAGARKKGGPHMSQTTPVSLPQFALLWPPAQAG